MASSSYSSKEVVNAEELSEEDDYEWADGPTIASQDDDNVECGCCFEACAFASMVQCGEGHLFCTTCLRRHVENSIFGDSCGYGAPSCLAISGCSSSYPWSEIRKCFSDDIWLKYEQRRGEDAVAKAQVTGLVYCYHCSHPWEVDPGTKIFTCLSESCLKVTCVSCRGANHDPEPCRTSEKNSEDSVRTEVEESMTKALIRVCSFCSAEMVKTDGCNKIMCRCGQQMCYLCREDIKDYSHFCPHIRAPQTAPCEECSLCCLWEKEDEGKVVKAAKSAAIEKLAEQYPDVLKRQIGPSEEAELGPRKRRFKGWTVVASEHKRKEQVNPPSDPVLQKYHEVSGRLTVTVLSGLEDAFYAG